MTGEESDGFLAAFVRRPATCRGHLYMMPAGYPALVHTTDGQPIHGEYVELPNFGILKVLDHFERVSDGLYLRREVQIDLGAAKAPAWAYVLTIEMTKKRQMKRLRVDDWRKLRAY